MASWEGTAISLFAVCLGIMAVASLAGPFWAEQRQLAELEKNLLDLQSAPPVVEEIAESDSVVSSEDESLVSFVSNTIDKVNKQVDSKQFVAAARTLAAKSFSFLFKFFTGDFIPSALFPDGYEWLRLLIVVPMAAGALMLLLSIALQIAAIVAEAIPF